MSCVSRAFPKTARQANRRSSSACSSVRVAILCPMLCSTAVSTRAVRWSPHHRRLQAAFCPQGLHCSSRFRADVQDQCQTAERSQLQVYHRSPPAQWKRSCEGLGSFSGQIGQTMSELEPYSLHQSTSLYYLSLTRWALKLKMGESSPKSVVSGIFPIKFPYNRVIPLMILELSTRNAKDFLIFSPISSIIFSSGK